MGPFRRKEDLLGVSGIGPIKYHTQHHVIVGPTAGASSAGMGKHDHSLVGYEAAEDDDDDSDVEPPDLPPAPASRSAPHICREVDCSVRTSLFSDLSMTEMAATNAEQDDAILVASWNIRNLSKRKDMSSLQRIAEIIDEFDLVALQV